MKKIFITLCAAALAVSASAFGLQPKMELKPAPGNMIAYPIEASGVVAMPKAPSRASGSMNFSPAGEPYSALSANNQKAGDQQGMAFKMTKAQATAFAGNKITGINFYAGINQTTKTNRITKATVFITNDLQGTDLYSQETTCPTEAWSHVNVDLATPYTIEAGKAIYVGVRFKLTDAGDLAIVVDNMRHSNDNGGWVGLGGATGAMQWDNIAEYYGFVCVGATITGDNLPENRMSVPAGIVEYVSYPNTPFTAQILVQNEGANELTSAEVSARVGTEAPVTANVNFQKALPYGGQAVITLDDLVSTVADKDLIPVEITVTKVNGVENLDPDKTYTGGIQIVPTGKGYKQNAVIEEFTGTWCGWCPRGIVAMEYMRDNYTDGSVIPVAVHVGQDAMVASTYSKVQNFNFSGGAPAAVVNRKWSADVSNEGFIETCAMVNAMPAIAEVKATASIDSDTRTVTIDTKTAFVFDYTDADKRFILSYGITEDNVGPYKQTNYYAGGQNGEMDGWEKRGQSVSTMYNDVARQLETFNGISGSIPAQITAGAENAFSYSFKLVTAAKKIEDLNVIVYLLDNQTKTIVNAAMIKSDKINDGVENVTVDNSSAPVEYFNLQGLRVTNPEGGIYIRRQGTDVKKVFVK